jgi:hypothetical protein
MINFPDTPTVNQTFTTAGVTWIWDGIKWNMSSIAGSAFITVSSSPPPGPVLGSLWWDSIGGQLYIWFIDGDSAQWVSAVNQGFGGLYLPLVGGALTGPLMLAANPTAALGAATKAYVDLIPPSYPLGSNRIINGDFLVTQTGANGTINGITCDRWKLGMNQAGKLNWQVAGSAAMVPNGFPRCMSITSLSAYTALAADSFCFFQPIEANMVSDFSWGTPGAQPVTLSFWVNVSIAGQYSGSVSNYGPPASRCYPFTFNAPAGWSKQIVTIPGDTGGTWVMSGNNGSVYVNFDLGSGSNLRGTANQWQNGNLNGAIGTAGIVATNGAIYQLTGIKLEIGSIATPYNMESVAKRMLDCQRYYQSVSAYWNGNANSGSAYYAIGFLPVTPRAAPTLTGVSLLGAPAFANAIGNLSSGPNSNTFVSDSRICSTTTTAGLFATIITANAEL